MAFALAFAFDLALAFGLPNGNNKAFALLIARSERANALFHGTPEDHASAAASSMMRRLVLAIYMSAFFLSSGPRPTLPYTHTHTTAAQKSWLKNANSAERFHSSGLKTFGLGSKDRMRVKPGCVTPACDLNLKAHLSSDGHCITSRRSERKPTTTTTTTAAIANRCLLHTRSKTQPACITHTTFAAATTKASTGYRCYLILLETEAAFRFGVDHNRKMWQWTLFLLALFIPQTNPILEGNNLAI